MFYSTLPFPLKSEPLPRNKVSTFYLKDEIVLGEKVGLHMPCPRGTVIKPGMNDELTIRFMRNGEPSLEKLVRDWRDDDPTWNWPDQLFILLFGKKISVRLHDLSKIRRRAYVREECEHFEIIQLIKSDVSIAIKIEFFHPKDTKYLYIKNNIANQFFAQTSEDLEECAKKFRIPLEEFAGEWVELS